MRLTQMICFACLATSVPTVAAPPVVERILYHQLQGDPEAAYIEALTIERREALSPNVRIDVCLSRTGLAFELDLDVTARTLLDSLEKAELTAVDRNRLSLFLARQAYAEGDQNRLGASLSSIGADSPQARSSRGQFLIAEHARLDGRHGDAMTMLRASRSSDPLAQYGWYNLGVDAVLDGRFDEAGVALRAVTRSRAKTLEAQALAQQASTALAYLSIQRGDTRSAGQYLEDLDVGSEAGLRGLVLLASLSMQAGDYSNAADLWQFVVEKQPWHPSAGPAHLALAYSLEQAYNTESAMPVWLLTRSRLESRAVELRRFIDALDELDGRDVAEAVLGAGTAPMMSSLQQQLGGPALLDVVATEAVRKVAARWLRLDDGRVRMEARLQDLDIYAEVGAEQARRSEAIEGSLSTNGFSDQLSQTEAKLEAWLSALAGIQRQLPYDHAILQFATTDERQQLARIDRLRQRAHEQSASVAIYERIARLHHRIQFEIHRTLAARLESRIAAARSLRDRVKRAQTSVERIATAARRVHHDDGILDRLDDLTARANTLQADLTQSLAIVRGQLIAALSADASTQLATIERQLIDVQLAIARLADQSMLTAEQP